MPLELYISARIIYYMYMETCVRLEVSTQKKKQCRKTIRIPFFGGRYWLNRKGVQARGRGEVDGGEVLTLGIVEMLPWIPVVLEITICDLIYIWSTNRVDTCFLLAHQKKPTQPNSKFALAGDHWTRLFIYTSNPNIRITRFAESSATAVSHRPLLRTPRIVSYSSSILSILRPLPSSQQVSSLNTKLKWYIK